MGRRGRRRANVALATAVLWTFLFGAPLAVADDAADATHLSDVEKTLAAVRDCMARNPPPWPEQWQNEYVDTILAAIATGREAPELARRLQIIREGFGPCWEGLAKNKERSLFEVHRAQIRWYVENLMGAELPGEEERQLLRHQYEELTEHATETLLAQFSFLDPNMVWKAKADHLAACYRNINAPLVPIYLTLLSEAQMGQMKQRWHDLRYARVDLWRSLGGHEVVAARPSNEHPDYVLTQRSFGQLVAQICTVAAPFPDYYRNALANEIDALRQRVESISQARAREMQLGNVVLEREYVTFLLAVLMETLANSQSGDAGEIARSNDQH